MICIIFIMQFLFSIGATSESYHLGVDAFVLLVSLPAV